MINFTNAGYSPRGFIMGSLLEQAEKCKAEYQTPTAFAELWMSFNAWKGNSPNSICRMGQGLPIRRPRH
jgi:hypothetical protein